MSHTKADGENDFLFNSDKDITVSSEEQEDAQQFMKKNFRTSGNLKKDTEEFTAKPENNSIKIRGFEIRPIERLLILEKKPLESYFDGLKTKKIIKKKCREPKKKYLDFSDLQSSPAVNEGWISTLAGGSPKEHQPCKVEHILQSRRLQAKVREYEASKKHNQHNISKKQRLAEEKYILQQENLVETWVGIIQRHNQLKNPSLEDFTPWPRPVCRRSICGKKFNTVDISLLSKEYWSDAEEKKPPRRRGKNEKTATLQTKSILDDLDKDFGEKLVFVDDEDESG